MRSAFVDSSVIVALAFNEPGAPALANRLAEFDVVCASPLLEAELGSACRREHSRPDPRLLKELHWIAPPHPISSEIARVLRAGYVRGADCYHLATALHLAPDGEGVTFLTLDTRQREVAQALGFTV